jgi:hypothetical protein
MAEIFSDRPRRVNKKNRRCEKQNPTARGRARLRRETPPGAVRHERWLFRTYLD